MNLRAISFDAAETDKERLARGAKPYVVGPSWFWDSPLAKQLEALDVSADPHDLAIWRDRFRALPRLGRVHLRVRAPAPDNGYGYLCRFVLDRDGDRIRLTLQGASSPVGVDPTALATLFGGAAGVFSSLGFERLGQPVTDAAAIAQLLGAYGEVGEIRGAAKLLEL